MKRYLKFVSIAAVLCGFQAAAHADTLDLFTFSLAGSAVTGNATINASPTPSSYSLGQSFTVAGVTGSYLGNSFTGDVTFFKAGGAGADGAVFGGDPLYSGLESSPVFKTGLFNLRGTADLGDGLVPISGTVTISALPASAPTPEPGTLAMVGTAALGMAGALRRRLA